MNVTPLPKIKVISDDEENASHLLGKTAHYNPADKSITLYTFGRHPKDVLRSFAQQAANATTASYVLQAVSASFATNASTASYVLNAISASYAATASSADNFLIRQNVTASNALITGTLTAQTIIAQYITSSTEFITGSTKFGTQLTDTHQFTGSVTITGSLSVNDSPVVTNSTFTPFSSSVSTRVTNLESTASVLTTASASFAIVSSSYASASGSLSIRTTNLETTASVLTTASASFAQQSGSNSIRLTNLEATASVLTTASASFAIVSPLERFETGIVKFLVNVPRFVLPFGMFVPCCHQLRCVPFQQPYQHYYP